MPNPETAFGLSMSSSTRRAFNRFRLFTAVCLRPFYPFPLACLRQPMSTRRCGRTDPYVHGRDPLRAAHAYAVRQGYSTHMARWDLTGREDARRLKSFRELGKVEFTWADLLSGVLAGVDVCVLYFPSRFDRSMDADVTRLLQSFAKNTSAKTSINFWDPTDQHFEQALALFDLPTPPAIVMVNGRVLPTAAAGSAVGAESWSITFTGDALLDEDRLVAGINAANQVLVKGDPRQIAALIRRRDVHGLVAAIGRVATVVRDQLVALKPKVGLPGGISIGVG